MKKRPAATQDKLETNMAAMIDIVFQLLIFFMLQLKIIQPEGDFSINMPPPGQGAPNLGPITPDIKVKLRANEDGSLASVMLGQRNLGRGAGAFQTLNAEILKVIGRPGDPATKDTEVEIDADYHLHFRHVINAVGACTGKIDKSGKLVRYIEKIKFTPPKRPADAE